MDSSRFVIYLTKKGLSAESRRRIVHHVEKVLRASPSLDDDESTTFLLRELERTSPAHYNWYLKSLKHYYAFIQKEFPQDLVYLKEEPKARVCLSDEQILQVIEVEPPPNLYGMFWLMLAFSGSRPDELLRLTVSDIDLQNGTFYVHHSKTKRPRIVPLLPTVKDALRTYLPNIQGAFVFPSPSGNGSISNTAYLKNWKKRLLSLGISTPATPYSFRHSYITNALGNGANLFAVQDIVGHSSANSTRKYYHGNIDLMKKAAARLPLAQKHSDPKELADQLSQIMDEFLMKDDRFDVEELLEAKKHIYRAIKKPEK